MSKTLFEIHNARFSDMAHEAAIRKIYPLFFKNGFTCESTSLYKSKEYAFLDGKKKIDRIFHFDTHKGKGISITVQERFRRAEYYKNRDITLTEYNYESGVISEVFAIEAMYFVYAYYNHKTDSFGESIIINIAKLLRDVVNDKIKFTRKMNKKKQSFLCFDFDDLIKSGISEFHQKNY